MISYLYSLQVELWESTGCRVMGGEFKAESKNPTANKVRLRPVPETVRGKRHKAAIFKGMLSYFRVEKYYIN